MSSMSNLSNQESASTANLTTNIGGSCSRCTKLLETRKKVVEMKKERLKIVTALAKSESLVAEMDIAIAEYELKLELDRQQKQEDSQSGHADTKTSVHETSKKKTQKKSLEIAQRNVSTNEDSHQNSTENLKARNGDLTSKQQPRSESHKHKKNCNKPRTSIMCSIPLNKIIHFQNISIPGEHINTSYQNQIQHNTEKINTENFTNTSNKRKCILNGNAVSDLNANKRSEHVPAERVEYSSGNVGDAVDTFEQRKICLSMLKVTSHYRFCLTPSCDSQNQSALGCEECNQTACHDSNPSTISNR